MKPINSISVAKIINLLEPYGILTDFSCPRALYEHEFTKLSYSSADVCENTFFLCKGAAFKEEYLSTALKAGAGAYLAEKHYEGFPAELPFVQVSDIRLALSLVSIAFYGEPAQAFTLIGITGTKGKTTTSYFMKHILDHYAKRPTAILSTIEVYTGQEAHDAHLTTPEPPDLQRYFAQTRESGLPFLTMEVSSQAYKTKRVYGVEYDLGMFLNLGEDHIGPLEHSDFEDYFSCKLELMKHCKTAVINRDMEQAERVFAVAKEQCKRVISFGGQAHAERSDPDCWILEEVQKQETGFSFRISHGGIFEDYAIKMSGRFNVENALAAIASAQSLGVDRASIAEGLLENEVKGRMNLLERDGLTVLVDYAHNYLSFSKLYESIKADYPGRHIVALFGCPGGKAQLRRRDIGTLSGKNADYIYLTAEDPQFEDVNEICREIASYIEPYHVPYEIIPDRTKAIETAIANAKPGDILLLAAKGEEVYQKVRGEYEYFESDIAIAKRCLSIS